MCTNYFLAVHVFVILLTSQIRKVNGRAMEAFHTCIESDVSSVILCNNLTIDHNLEQVTVQVKLNPCHTPWDITFHIRPFHEKWQWEHTFVNSDELHEIYDTKSYTLLRVHLNVVKNDTMVVQANFAVDGEQQKPFLKHSFRVENQTCSETQHQPVKSFNMQTILPLIVFIVLCFLLVLTLCGFLLWVIIHCGRHKMANQNTSLMTSATNSRPVSSAYTDDEYLYEIDDNSKSFGKKSSTVVRNSLYNADVSCCKYSKPTSNEHSAYADDGTKYNSLPRHFGGHNWISESEEDLETFSRTLPRKGTNHAPAKGPVHEILAKEYLNINSGTSQPHYSATLFRSFRDSNKSKTTSPSSQRQHNQSPLKASYSQSPYKAVSSHGKLHSNASACKDTPKKRRREEKGVDDSGLSSVHLLHDQD